MKFPKFSVGRKDNAFALRRYIFNYLEVKYYTDGNQFLNGSAKKKKKSEYMHVEKEMSMLIKDK